MNCLWYLSGFSILAVNCDVSDPYLEFYRDVNQSIPMYFDGWSGVTQESELFRSELACGPLLKLKWYVTEANDAGADAVYGYFFFRKVKMSCVSLRVSFSIR